MSTDPDGTTRTNTVGAPHTACLLTANTQYTKGKNANTLIAAHVAAAVGPVTVPARAVPSFLIISTTNNITFPKLRNWAAGAAVAPATLAGFTFSVNA